MLMEPYDYMDKKEIYAQLRKANKGLRHLSGQKKKWQREAIDYYRRFCCKAYPSTRSWVMDQCYEFTKEVLRAMSAPHTPEGLREDLEAVMKKFDIENVLKRSVY